jgi:hypothetical protein
MFSLYRKLELNEFFVVFGDCAQGGEDSNVVQFMSKTTQDIPLKLKMPGVAAGMTPYLHQALEWVYDQTKVRPVVALERNNGGASEMHNLMMMNRNGKYTIYQMKSIGRSEGREREEILGWNTTMLSRPTMLGDWKVAYDGHMIRLYDEDTLSEHKTFIVAKNGKPQAAPNTHDDEVMSCAGAWQLYQTELAPTSTVRRRPEVKRMKFHV